MGNTQTWETLPVEKDGWVRSHNALRLDAKDLSEGIEVMRSEVERTKEIDGAKTVALVKYWDHFAEVLHDHHDSEEKIFFPRMAARVQLPPSMSADHAVLSKDLEAATALAKSLLKLEKEHNVSEYQTTLTNLGTALQALQTKLEQHYHEEESVGIPLLRAHFTRGEVMDWVQAMVRKMPWHSMPHMLRPFPTEELKRETMIDMDIPRLVVGMILMPRVRRYAEEFESQLTLIRTPSPKLVAAAAPRVVAV
eukprot:m.24816 g.24816  ORF g.24816 m.24816 type:complete len:251 (+) comp8776_c0_seq1:421-1173(+)